MEFHADGIASTEDGKTTNQMLLLCASRNSQNNLKNVFVSENFLTIVRGTANMRLTTPMSAVLRFIATRHYCNPEISKNQFINTK